MKALGLGWIATVCATGLMGSTPAMAQTATPTLSFDQPCYAEGDTIGLSGTGYTPGGVVSLAFPMLRGIGTFATVADASGAFAGSVSAPDADEVLTDDEDALDVTITASDQARIEADPPPDPSTQFAASTLRYSRSGLYASRRVIAPRRSIVFRVLGFTRDAGRPLYLHYVKGARSIKVLRVGLLRRCDQALSPRVPVLATARALPALLLHRRTRAPGLAPGSARRRSG